MSIIFHRIRSRILVPPVLILALVAMQSHQRGRVCAGGTEAYAFIRNGDLWLSHGADAHALTRDGNYNDFAVSDDGSYLAVLQTVGKPPAARISVVPMGKTDSRLTIEVSPTTSLIATCGTIASLENNDSLHRRVAITKDLIKQKDFAKQAFVDFRCDSQRETTIGYKSFDDRSLTVVDHLGKKAPLESLPNLFDIQPRRAFRRILYSPSGHVSFVCLGNS